MKGFHTNVEEATVKNSSFRKIAYTGAYSQLVYMRLKPGEDIGLEKHGADQFFRIEKGTGVSKIDDQTYNVKDGSVIIVPAGAMHNLTNTSKTDDLHLYTIYSIPNHVDGEDFPTKKEAEANDKPFDGRTTEHQDY